MVYSVPVNWWEQVYADVKAAVVGKYAGSGPRLRGLGLTIDDLVSVASMRVAWFARFRPPTEQDAFHRNYIRRAARNAASSEVRAAERVRDRFRTDREFEACAYVDDERQALPEDWASDWDALLAGLTDRQREVMRQTVVYGRTHAWIAKELGLSPRQVKDAMTDARKILRVRWESKERLAEVIRCHEPQWRAVARTSCRPSASPPRRKGKTVASK